MKPPSRTKRRPAPGRCIAFVCLLLAARAASAMTLTLEPPEEPVCAGEPLRFSVVFAGSDETPGRRFVYVVDQPARPIPTSYEQPGKHGGLIQPWQGIYDVHWFTKAEAPEGAALILDKRPAASAPWLLGEALRSKIPTRYCLFAPPGVALALDPGEYVFHWKLVVALTAEQLKPGQAIPEDALRTFSGKLKLKVAPERNQPIGLEASIADITVRLPEIRRVGDPPPAAPLKVLVKNVGEGPWRGSFDGRHDEWGIYRVVRWEPAKGNTDQYEPALNDSMYGRSASGRDPRIYLGDLAPGQTSTFGVELSDDLRFETPGRYTVVVYSDPFELRGPKAAIRRKRIISVFHVDVVSIPSEPIDP